MRIPAIPGRSGFQAGGAREALAGLAAGQKEIPVGMARGLCEKREAAFPMLNPA